MTYCTRPCSSLRCFFSFLPSAAPRKNLSRQTDTDCNRGEVCDDDSKSCTGIPCRSVNDCPGTGRTCLEETGTCSVKECGAEGLTCPEGTLCNESGPYLWSCSAVMAPPMDAIAPAQDQGQLPVGDAMTGNQDMGVVANVGICSPCEADRDCRALGDGAQCTPIGSTGSFCTSACDPDNSNCPEGFTCLNELGQCVPSNYDCTVCPGRPCEDGNVCDLGSGQCVMPRQSCEPCSSDASCADGLVCRSVNNGQFCLAECAGPMDCPDNYGCEMGVLRRHQAIVMPADGACAAPTPSCVAETGMCAECGNADPCPIGQFCDPETRTCSQDQPCECGSDLDCQQCGGRPICLQGNCVACLDDTDCPARTACNPETFSCDASPCGGVECQGAAVCDPSVGRCDPGCNSPNDCGVPNSMGCHAETGQCSYREGTCDPGPGGQGVCAPGGTYSQSPHHVARLCLPKGRSQ